MHIGFGGAAGRDRRPRTPASHAGHRSPVRVDATPLEEASSDGQAARATDQRARGRVPGRPDVPPDLRHATPRPRASRRGSSARSSPRAAHRPPRPRQSPRRLPTPSAAGSPAGSPSAAASPSPLDLKGNVRFLVGPWSDRRGRPPQAHRPGLQRALPERHVRLPAVPVGHGHPGDQHLGDRGRPRHLHDDRELVPGLRGGHRLRRTSPPGSTTRPSPPRRPSTSTWTGSRPTARRSWACRSAGTSRTPCS